MTINELRSKLNDFGLNEFPKTFEVDAVTYANVCQGLFNHLEKCHFRESDLQAITVSLGPNNGIMFKNVELILKS